MNAATVRAVQVIGGLDNEFGGPSYSVPRLCRALAANGVKITLLSVAGSGEPASEVEADGYCDLRFKRQYERIPVLRSLRKSRGFATALRAILPQTDVVHNHGLWLTPNLMSGWQALAVGKPYVVSPRGMLSPAALGFSRWKKWSMWHLGQADLLRRAHCIHATSELEYRELRSLGLSSPIAMIPNGIDVADQAPSPRANSVRQLLSFGRLHPKKNLENLVQAWAALEPRFPDWQLRIVGPAEGGYDDRIRSTAEKLGVSRFSVEGPVYDRAKEKLFCDAGLFVLPSLSENFGLVVAEALAAGVPVVATKGTPWSGLETEECGWWAHHDVASLTAVLAEAMTLPSDVLRAKGARGRAWMLRDFSWSSVATRMGALYLWLSGHAALPSTVRLN